MTSAHAGGAIAVKFRCAMPSVSSDLELAPCPFCRSSSSRHVLELPHGAVWSCQHCGSLRRHPTSPPGEAERYYRHLRPHLFVPDGDSGSRVHVSFASRSARSTSRSETPRHRRRQRFVRPHGSGGGMASRWHRAIGDPSSLGGLPPRRQPARSRSLILSFRFLRCRNPHQCSGPSTRSGGAIAGSPKGASPWWPIAGTGAERNFPHPMV